MMNLLRALLAIATALICVGFALAHTQGVQLFFSPLHDPLTLPMAAVALGFFAFGFLVGGVMVWLNGHEKRRELRALKKQAKVQEKEIDRWRNMSSESAILARPGAAE